MTRTFRKLAAAVALAAALTIPAVSYADKAPYLEGLVLNLVFRTQVATKPAAVCIRLCTNVPSDATACTEVANSNAYARVAVTQADASWAAPSGDPSLTSNSAAITFPTATGAGWGTLQGFEAIDSCTYGAGNRLYWGSLTTTPTITAGMTPSFAIGQLTFSED